MESNLVLPTNGYELDKKEMLGVDGGSSSIVATIGVIGAVVAGIGVIVNGVSNITSGVANITTNVANIRDTVRPSA
ncbi:MAG: hypothetical protein FWB72_04890 [Firmicutes bacterium]|nr:hypothetical protein [Bacillota bacterium]